VAHVAALAIVVAVVATLAILLRPEPESQVTVGRSTTTVSTTTASTTTGSTSTSSSSTTPTTTTTTAPPPTLLRVGSVGSDVAALEARLAALGMWLGTPDDRFDEVTAHAVVAFEKLHGLERDGIAGPIVRAALATATRPVPRSSTGHALEIDLTRQVLLVADVGAVTAVIDISTGRVPGTTPVGHFQVLREIEGYHRSPLGVLYRPKYFHGGVAIHGYPSVPPAPASHGCVRTVNAAMDWLWASGAAAIGTPVWVYAS
jgi:peptidoglycan hydrolase-like protein with peptidoglycan-binding domain